MSTKLTLDDRFHLNMYVRRLPCTLRLRSAIDTFISQVDLTQEEIASNGIKFDASAGMTCQSEAETEYDSFPEPVIAAMKEYIRQYDHEKNAENQLLQKMLGYFRKII